MMNHVKKEHIDTFLISGLAICLVVTLSCIEKVVTYLNHAVKPTVPSVEKKEPENIALFNTQAFNDVKIEGKAYVVYDLVDHKIIASQNETAILPLASITKVMTAVSSTLHKGKDEKITITRASIEDGFDLGLRDKQVWELSELLKYTLIFSSNDGAEAVADSFGSKEVFLNHMNTDAKSLGLNLVFTDPAGRDLNGKIGGQGTAVDVAKLFGVAREKIPDILDATTKKRETVIASSGRLTGVPNTNQQIENLSGAEASKTGFTDKAGGNLGVIVDVSVGHPVVLVVLGSTKEGRFRDMQKLYQALRESLVLPQNIQ